MQSLPAEVALSAISRTHRRLSRRRVRKELAIGQRWDHVATGRAFTVRQIHRKDGRVALLGPGQHLRYFTFGELSHQFELVETEA